MKIFVVYLIPDRNPFNLIASRKRAKNFLVIKRLRATTDEQLKGRGYEFIGYFEAKTKEHAEKISQLTFDRFMREKRQRIGKINEQ